MPCFTPFCPVLPLFTLIRATSRGAVTNFGISNEKRVKNNFSMLSRLDFGYKNRLPKSWGGELPPKRATATALVTLTGPIFD